MKARVFLDVKSASGVESSWGVRTDEALLFECPATGLRFRTPAPREKIAAFYGAEYHDRMVGDVDQGSDQHARTAAYRKENEARIGVLKRYLPNGRVLDVGCSTGLFASQLAEAGFEAFGSDISEYACQRAAEALSPSHVFHGPVESLRGQFSGKKALDAITLMDVIEHFEDVVTPLRAMRDMLAPRGILFLRTPTLRSPFYGIADLSYRLTAGRYKDAVLKIYHAEHFYFFTEKSMADLLHDTGFEVLAIEPDPLCWTNFKSAELRHGPIVNSVLSALWFGGRLAGRGHGMRVVARRRAAAGE